tara:strand:- start:115640 stop:116749 length:1110 start_codon:yes stop_codon:yes gene_type:complete
MSTNFDIAIVGGGLYGCRTAILLAQKGKKVVLLEQENSLLSRASRNNQSRIHNGYHYPRSLMTAIGSHRNYERFKTDYSACVVDDFKHIYAIAGHTSKINPYQFKSFCNVVGIPLSEPTKLQRGLFDFNRIDEIFIAEEASINTDMFSDIVTKQVEAEPNITIHLNKSCTRVHVENSYVCLKNSGEDIKAGGVIIATYANLNNFLISSDLKPLGLKLELTEMPLIKRPQDLQQTGITVMDGAFFSVMPFGGEGYATLSHVHYTPHASALAGKGDAYKALENYKQSHGSHFPFMRNDAARYIPSMRQAEYIDTIFEVKAIPVKNELDDGRPILICEHVGALGGAEPFVVSLLGSKLDTIYEWELALNEKY